MANIKMTPSNYDKILDDMATEIGTARTDMFYFSPTELNDSTIRQMAWKKNLILSIENVDGFISKLNYLDTLK